MGTEFQSGGRFRRGLFEISLCSGEVFKVHVQEQPLQVLALLLRHPGQIVSREELQNRLWPADTYVGFDEGLNTAIRKLRLLLGDSADNPRFIETVPRRGYRFIAPVTELSPVQNAHRESNEDAAASNEPPASAESRSESPTPAPRLRKGMLISTGIGIIALAILAIAFLRRSQITSGVPPDTQHKLLVLPFQNLSGNPAQEYFSDGLTEETITDLGALSPAHLGVIARTSAMSYKHTSKTVGQIGHELGVDYVLEGSIRTENGRTRISAQLIRVSDQIHVWAQNYDAREKEDLLEIENAIGRAIAEQVRLNTVPQHQRARPVNPEAYDLYLKGRFYTNANNFSTRNARSESCVRPAMPHMPA